MELKKKHNAAQARLHVYSEAHNTPLTLNPLSDPFFPSQQAMLS